MPVSPMVNAPETSISIVFELTKFKLLIGVHVDTKGRLYAGCGDGVHVWNPSGTLIGKIFLGETSANFNFAGNGGMVICAETNLYYAKIATTSGAYTGDRYYCQSRLFRMKYVNINV